MNSLVRFLLRDMPLVAVLFVGCIVVAMAYAAGGLFAEDFALIWTCAGLASALAILFSIQMSSGEFLFTLPFTRSRVFRARLYAAGSVILVGWLPAACAFVVGVFSTHSVSVRGAVILAVNQAAVTLELMALAQYVYALPPARTLRAVWVRIAALIAGAIVLYYLPTMLVDPSTSIAPAVAAMAAVPLTIFLQRGALDGIELLPEGDTQALRVAPDSTAAVSDSGSRLIERLSPYWRVVTRGLLLRWAYVYSAAIVCFISSWAVGLFVRGPSVEVSVLGLAILGVGSAGGGATGFQKLSGLFPLPVRRRTLFRTVQGPHAVLIVLSVAAAALFARHDIDEFHIRRGGNWYPGMMEAAAAAKAHDIQEQYGVPVGASDLLAQDPVEGWVIDSAGIRQRLMDARGRTAVVGGLTVTVVYLTFMLWLVFVQSGRMRLRVLRVSSKLLALLIFAGMAAFALSSLSYDTFLHIPIPRGFLVAHFWPLTLGLAAGCALLWALSEHFFEHYEPTNVPQRKM